MRDLLLVTVPAVVAAAGSVATAYVGVKVRNIAQATNGRLRHLENELALTRRLLDNELEVGGSRWPARGPTE